MIQRISTTAFLVFLAPAALLASPPEFALEPAPVTVGSGWLVRTSTRVEQEPVRGKRGFQPQALDYAQASSEVRFRVLKDNDQGQVQLKTRSAAQTITIVSKGERTEEQRPEQTVIEWAKPADLAGAGEVGPTSLLRRKQTHVGDTWSTEGELLVGGVAPVKVKMTYTVRAKKVVGGKTLLRITCEGQGLSRAEDGSSVSVSAKGVMHIDPAQADRPRKVVLVYRFRVTGGGVPDVATRTTIRLETEDLPAAK